VTDRESSSRQLILNRDTIIDSRQISVKGAILVQNKLDFSGQISSMIVLAELKCRGFEINVQRSLKSK